MVRLPQVAGRMAKLGRRVRGARGQAAHLDSPSPQPDRFPVGLSKVLL